MTFYSQTPVGNKIRLGNKTDDLKSIYMNFRPYDIFFYDSGTSALAVSIIAILKKSCKNKPEVILPAYGCPDIVSAIRYAGAIPKYIDLESKGYRMNLEKLVESISNDTVAIIVVNFLGLSDRVNEIKEIGEKYNIFIIEDNAQKYPVHNGRFEIKGDISIISFGRGKPINMLTGGAVLLGNEKLKPYIENNKDLLPATIFQQIIYSIKIRIYNYLITPLPYSIIGKLPFINIGKTIYKPLKKINNINPTVLSFLDKNIHRKYNYSICLEYRKMLISLNDDRIIDLTRVSNIDNKSMCLRYPILILDKGLRDNIYKILSKEGLGSSIMYPDILPKLCAESDRMLNTSQYTNATEFSGYILTLPTHERINISDVDNIRNVFNYELSRAM